MYDISTPYNLSSARGAGENRLEERRDGQDHGRLHCWDDGSPRQVGGRSGDERHPGLISSGILLVVFAALWLGFGAALATNPSALDDTWRSVRELPLPIQGIAWLLLMPLLVGLWVWGTDWPLVVRLVLIAGIAGWNVLVFMPRRGNARVASVKSLTAPR